MPNASVISNYLAMLKGRDWQYILKRLEDPFPRFWMDPVTTTSPTKINIVVPIIPEPARDIMDLTLLVLGVNLNTLLGLVIVLNSSTRTSANCYIMSLLCSNLIILVEPLQQVLRWIFDIKLRLNLDYIFLVTFDTSIVTIIILNIELYIVVSQTNSSLRASLLKISTAIKCILLIWIICISLISMELHMYEHFEKEIMYDIYVTYSIMFLIFPCFIFIMLDYFILYDLMLSKAMKGTWSRGDIEHFSLLIGIKVVFLVTMIPYRIMKAAALITSFCCSDTTIEIVYTMVKIYPVLLPVICFVMSKKFRQFEVTLCRQRHEISAIT